LNMNVWDDSSMPSIVTITMICHWHHHHHIIISSPRALARTKQCMAVQVRGGARDRDGKQTEVSNLCQSSDRADVKLKLTFVLFFAGSAICSPPVFCLLIGYRYIKRKAKMGLLYCPDQVTHPTLLASITAPTYGDGLVMMEKLKHRERVGHR